jgi:hypothetical protein
MLNLSQMLDDDNLLNANPNFKYNTVSIKYMILLFKPVEY